MAAEQYVIMYGSMWRCELVVWQSDEPNPVRQLLLQPATAARSNSVRVPTRTRSSRRSGLLLFTQSLVNPLPVRLPPLPLSPLSTFSHRRNVHLLSTLSFQLAVDGHPCDRSCPEQCALEPSPFFQRCGSNTVFAPFSLSTPSMLRVLALAISVRVDWTCIFTIISLCLAILYSLLLFVCLFYSIRLLRLPCYKRQSQRVFLTLVALQCILRALYFFLWPLLMANNEPRCTISVEGEHEGVVMLITGSLPSALLLSAFTTNVFTFARIYHTTLNHSVMKYRLVLCAMALVNLLTYAALALLYLASFANLSDRQLSDKAEVLYLYALSCSFFVIAASFSYYGIKLWLGVRAPSLRFKDTSSPSFSSVDHHYPQHNATAARHSFHSTPFLTPSSSFASSTNLPSTSSASCCCCWSCGCAGTSYHPMLKLAIISTLCMLCFLVRVVLLPLLSHYTSGQFSFPLLLLYLCLSEVLPLLLVLYLFDPVREGKNVLRSEGRGGGFGVDESDDYWRVDDEGEYGVHGGPEGHVYDAGGRTSPRSAGSVASSGPSQVGTPVPSLSYVDLSLPSSLPASLSSVGSRDVHHMLPTLSPRELDRRRARNGMSYESAFKQDLKSLLADD